jgi:hypothetical protein
MANFLWSSEQCLRRQLTTYLVGGDGVSCRSSLESTRLLCFSCQQTSILPTAVAEPAPTRLARRVGSLTPGARKGIRCLMYRRIPQANITKQRYNRQSCHGNLLTVSRLDCWTIYLSCTTRISSRRLNHQITVP